MRIDALHLQTARPNRLREFYSKCGLDTTGRDDGGVSVAFGATTVEFEPAPEGTNPFYHFAVNIPTNQFDDAVAWVRDRTELLTAPETGEETVFFEFMNADAVYVRDPAGDIVELIARHDLPGSGDQFGPGSLQRVSEIGLPTPEVTATVEALEASVDVTRWPESNDEFAVVGDDEGMFIVVEAGRPWYPTDEEAAPFPVTVVTPDATAPYAFSTLPYRIETV